MNFSNSRTGTLFRQAQSIDQSTFEKLFEVFKELITHTSGDFDEAIDWLRELNEEYQLTDENYTIDDFINELLDKDGKNSQRICLKPNIWKVEKIGVGKP